MEILKCFLFALLLSFSPTVIVHGQDQTDFISLDCGLAQDTDYFHSRTGIHYISDAAFIDTGVSNTISPDLKPKVYRQFLFLRSFPKGARNCYALRPARGAKGNKFLIRALFKYGNYDGKAQPPQFDLHLGVNFWDTVTFSPYDSVSKEIIHTPSTDYINVCLVNTGHGVPFISVLELRPLNNSMYDTPGSLQLIDRLNFGSASNEIVRYKDDIYDRMWWPAHPTNVTTLSTSNTVNCNNTFQPPDTVMSTAVTPTNANGYLFYSRDAQNSTDPYYVCFHLAELQQLSKFDSREANIYINGFHVFRPFAPVYLATDTIYGKIAAPSGPQFQIIINQTANSTLPPIINAIELYAIKEVFHSQTDENEVAAMMGIKSMYGVMRNWEGDPCAPQAYLWVGVSCNFDGFNSLRIVSLNLSSSGLNEVIAPYITNLTMIQSLDLSNNNLTGQIPDFLSGLTSLRVLNLKGNNFTGSVPAELLARAKNGWLSLSTDIFDYTNPCQSASCTTTTTTTNKKKFFVVPLVASVVALLLLLVALAMSCFIKRRNEQGEVIVPSCPPLSPSLIRRVGVENKNPSLIGRVALELKNRQFPYSEVLIMTNKFERVVGKGGFGAVYHGYVGQTQVAVKMLSPSSTQGHKEFQAEANLLIKVHHRNLTSLVGYCNEGTHIGLIYEYMSNGSLDRHLLSDSNSNVLSWEQRLQIAVDAAQGLEYLHNGCKPPIVHRDVKCSNILLNENFQAKISDFGLSRAFPDEGATHVSTTVAGTPGYLDLEHGLTEKGDVYSFGVVLLEIITGRKAMARSNGNIHITEWVEPMVEKGDIQNIADPKLGGEFNVNSMWKAVELARACVSGSPTERPTMNEVVMELKQCLATGHGTTGLEDYSIGNIPLSMEYGLSPPTK